MGFSCGIVGLPNVGKSTLFNSLSNAKAEAQNFPFCTIEPNVGIVPVPDPRLTALAKLYEPDKKTPASIRFVDIAGLVRGASKGEGLGNQFLSHIREVDAIAHVVRCFEDTNVTHVEGRVDPVQDVATIQTELCLRDLDTVTKRVDRARRAAKSGDVERTAVGLCERLLALLDQGKPARLVVADEKEAPILRELSLLTDKKVFYVANVAETALGNLEQDKHFSALKRHAESEQAEIVPICAAIEAQIAELEPADRPEFLASVGLTEPGLNRVIHTDFERGFIKAEVIWWEDLIALGSEAKCRDAGKLAIEGKDYIVRDGDVIHFRFNV
jgi:GTP-binding protein YchF